MGTGGSKGGESPMGTTKNQYIDFAPGTPTYNVVRQFFQCFVYATHNL